MASSNLNLLIEIYRKRPYVRKTDQNFTAMTAAEQKRRRKRAQNFALARTGAMGIVIRNTHLVHLLGSPLK